MRIHRTGLSIALLVISSMAASGGGLDPAAGLQSGVGHAGASPDARCPVDITAVFSIDATEDSDGVFVRKNISTVGNSSFKYLRYHMRPVTLSGGAPGTQVTLETSPGGVLSVYTETGAEVTLPAVFDVADLPVTLLVNGAADGEAKLNARDPTSQDGILFRVGCFPGLGGRSLGSVCPGSIAQDLAIAADHGEQVVEVVGDPPG